MNVPIPYADLQDFAFEITTQATMALSDRLLSSGVEHPHVVADLALAALAMRLSPEKASRLAESKDAAGAVKLFSPPATPVELAEREAEAEGKLIRFPRSRRF